MSVLSEYQSSSSTSPHLLTPTSHTERLSATPSPLASPSDPNPFGAAQSFQLGSAYTGTSFKVPNVPDICNPVYATTTMPPSYFNPIRRASIAVTPSHLSTPSYQFDQFTPFTTSYPIRPSTCNPNTHPTGLSSPPQPLSIEEQESLPSWRRDFDKISDSTIKSKWAQELYQDFRNGRIPVTGRVNHDIIDWESCVAKVNGVRDAEMTAKLLVSAQHRKADLQAGSSKAKAVGPDKEPPRRQNKFICYRSLRSTQLAAYFINFKQSQFSAITSLEWKEIDTDWWGEVANLVEEVRRSKYMGQLDTKGNSLRRASIDTQLLDPYSTPYQPASRAKKGKSSAGVKQSNRQAPPPPMRFEPYAIAPKASRPTPSRITSYAGTSLESPISPSALQYRHSIGSIGEHLHTPREHVNHSQGLGLYDPRGSEPATGYSFPYSPNQTPTQPSHISSGLSAHAVYYTEPSAPFIFQSPMQPLTSDPESTTPPGPPPSALQTTYAIDPNTSYFQSASTTFPFTPGYSVGPSDHSNMYSTPQQLVPQLQQSWDTTPVSGGHARGHTTELMEVFTRADDYNHFTQNQPVCFGGDNGWTSQYPQSSR